MRLILLLGVFGVVFLYVGLVHFLGFQGFMAETLNFFRVGVAAAVLVIYLPAIVKLFREKPAPRRDFLLAGIILTWLSGFAFSMWNKAGSVFGVTTSIFVSPIAGFFSLLLVSGGIFHLVAPDMAGPRARILAVGVGLAAGIVWAIMPWFR